MTAPLLSEHEPKNAIFGATWGAASDDQRRIAPMASKSGFFLMSVYLNRAHSADRGLYFNQFTNSVMMSALVKSMKNAPTSGTTRKALGAGPKRTTSARMFATALAVVPNTTPTKPLAITAES